MAELGDELGKEMKDMNVQEAANRRFLPENETSGYEKGGVDSSGRFILVQKHEVPSWLAFNPYILGGYRWNLTRTQCLQSILYIHNETGGRGDNARCPPTPRQTLLHHEANSLIGLFSHLGFVCTNGLAGHKG